MTKKAFSFLALLSLGLTTLSACGLEPAREADVRFHWTFDEKGCRAAGVSEVEIILEKFKSGRSYRTGEMDCRAEWVDIEDLRSGNYVVYAYGYRPGAQRARWALERRVRLHRGFNEFTLVLEPY